MYRAGSGARKRGCLQLWLLGLDLGFDLDLGLDLGRGWKLGRGLTSILTLMLTLTHAAEEEESKSPSQGRMGRVGAARASEAAGDRALGFAWHAAARVAGGFGFISGVVTDPAAVGTS